MTYLCDHNYINKMSYEISTEQFYNVKMIRKFRNAKVSRGEWHIVEK